VEAACTSHILRSNQWLPLLPSGPDGVHHLSSRENQCRPPLRGTTDYARSWRAATSFKRGL